MELLNMLASKQINKLISEGWEFMLHYGDQSGFCDISEPCWSADFTRKKEDGLWDNHESGYSISPSIAVDMAYRNIREGKKLNRKRKT